jgi:hypothetical protein
MLNKINSLGIFHAPRCYRFTNIFKIPRAFPITLPLPEEPRGIKVELIVLRMELEIE